MSTVLSSQLWRPTVVTPFFDGNFRIDNFDSVRGLRSDRLKLRQVPGDGSCLFYAIAGSLDYIRTSTHSSFDDKLCNDADMLRKLAVDTLSRDPKKILIIEQGKSWIKAGDLLKKAAKFQNISPKLYIKLMKQRSVWGGGPEIVSLANALNRTIHVFELKSKDNEFILHHAASFGPKSSLSSNMPHVLRMIKRPFAVDAMEGTKFPEIMIVCLDGRFPSIKPGCEKSVGDHFVYAVNS